MDRDKTKFEYLLRCKDRNAGFSTALPLVASVEMTNFVVV